MDEFDIILELTGSKETYRQNKTSCFHNLLAETLQLEGDCKMVLAEVFFPPSIKIATTKEYLVYTPKTPFKTSLSTGKTNSRAVMVERADRSNIAISPDGECNTVKDVATILHAAVAQRTRLIYTSSTEEDSVKFSFADGYGIGLHDRSLFDVLGFHGVPDPNRGR